MKSVFRTAALVLAAVSLAVSAGAQNHNRKVLPTDTFRLPGGGKLEINFIKHGSVALNYNGHVIYCDPATRFPKVKDFKVKYDTLDKADVILVTHSHSDHLDTLAIRDLIQPGTLVVFNRESGAMVKNLGVTMENGNVLWAGDWVKITAVPSANFLPGSGKTHPNDGRNNGYIMEFPGGFRVYFPGDIDQVPKVVCDPKRPIDVAFFPINQPTTMTVKQAAKEARRLKPKVLYPIHFNDSPVGQLPRMLKGTGIKVRIRPME